MKKSRIAVLLGALLVATAVYADADYFLGTDVGTSAEMIRIGNIEGFSSLSTSVFENPASLYRVRKFSASAFNTKFMNEVDYLNGSAALGLGGSTLAFGYMTTRVSDIPKTATQSVGLSGSSDDFEIVQVGSFAYENSIYRVAYSMSQSKNIHFGIAASYFTTTLDTVRGSGFNADGGIVIDAGDLILSVALKNIIPSLKVKYSNGYEENLAFQSLYSMKYHIRDFDVYGQLRTVGSNKRLTKSFGLNYSPSFLPLLRLSFGYKEFLVVRDVQSAQTYGVGLDLLGLSVDYAYEPSEHLEFPQKHYLSVGIKL